MTREKPSVRTEEDLTPADRECLTWLIQEASEVIKQATKLLIFGKHAAHEGVDYDNVRLLGLEVGDFLAVQNWAGDLDLVQMEHVRAGLERKMEKLPIFSRHRS
jgi:hypothetical protein